MCDMIDNKQLNSLGSSHVFSYCDMKDEIIEEIIFSDEEKTISIPRRSIINYSDISSVSTEIVERENVDHSNKAKAKKVGKFIAGGLLGGFGGALLLQSALKNPMEKREIIRIGISNSESPIYIIFRIGGTKVFECDSKVMFEPSKKADVLKDFINTLVCKFSTIVEENKLGG